MKRSVSFLLLLVYLFSSPALGYSLHYCGRVLTGVSLGTDDPDKSCCPAQKAPCGRCHDKHVSSPKPDATPLTAAALALAAPALLPEPAAYSWPAADRVRPFDPERQRPRAAARSAAPPPWPAYVRGHAFRL